MKVLILAEFVEPHPWGQSRWAVDLARGLHARGHEVVLACDGIYDPEELAPMRVLAHRHRRREHDRRPAAFHRWALRTMRREPHDVSLSLTRLAPADVRVEMDRPAVRALWAHVRGRNVVSAGFEAVQHPYLPLAVAAEALTRRSGRVKRVLMLGGVPGRLGPDELGYASRLATPEPGAFAALRRRTREALGVSPDRHAVLISAAHPERSGLRAFLEGFRGVRMARQVLPPVLLVAGGAGHGVHAAAVAAGVASGVRVIGGTSRIDAALAACDLAAAPLGGRHAGETGRFIADALRVGRPVAADQGVRGAELLGPLNGAGSARPGHVLVSPDAHHWKRALLGALSERWLEEAGAAAAVVGRELSMESLVARLEGALARARA